MNTDTLIDNVYLINLDKDVKRLFDSKKECKKIGIEPTRIDGVYGKWLSEEDTNGTVDKVYFNFGSKSAIGCAMSHVKAWEKMIENNDSSSLIIEDDVVIDIDFINKFNEIDIPDDYDIIYLGCTNGCDIDKKYSFEFPLVKYYISQNKYAKKVMKINEHIYVPSLPLALHGYILSLKGAKYLLDNIRKDKIYNHIDAQILKYLKNANSYAVNPQLIKQKDINTTTSNNIGGQYPSIINNFLSKYKDKWGVPLDYKLTISQFNIYGYNINTFSGLFILIGAILYISEINIHTVTTSFIGLNIIELFISRNPLYLIKQSIGSYFMLLCGYYSTAILPNLTKAIK